MKIETTPLEDHQIRLRVELDESELESAKHRAARKIAQKTKIPGFRPGKAPYNIVERNVGKEVITEEALEMLAQEIYPKALEESAVKPYGPGTLENIASTEPPVFEYVIPLEAVTELGEYRSIRVPYEPKPVSEDEVNEVLDNMRQQQAVLEPVERAAQEGDEVTIKMSAERVNPDEGEPVSLVNERSIPVVIEGETKDEEKAKNEWPFPGFSRELIGMKVGDHKDIEHTFAEDSSYESLRGKEAVFHFTVEGVKSRTLPELNDEFAQSQGDFENVEALTADVRKRIQERQEQEYNQDYDDLVFQELLKVATLKYPPQMLDEEKHSVLHQLENRLAQQGLDMDTYLKVRQMDHEALLKELEPTAEERLKRMLLLFELARKEDIKVSQQDVQEETMQTLNMMAQGMSEAELKKSISKDLVSNLANNITVDILIRNSQNFLRAVAKGEDPKAAQAAQEAEAESAESESGPAETVEEAVQQETQPEEETQTSGEPENPSTEGEATGE